MSKTYTIREIYDIATAFITDNKTKVCATSLNGDIMYTFTKQGLAEFPYQLVIFAQPGAPEQIPNTKHTNKKSGKIYLHRGASAANQNDSRTIIWAETTHNVGRALDKTQRDIVRFGTRLLSRRFFEILDMAEKRALGQLATKNNTNDMFNILFRIQELQH